MKTNIHDFIEVLNAEIDSRFPNTDRIAVAGGDSIRDWIIELREGNKKMRYSPYELFTDLKGDYESKILELCNAWENMKI